MIEPPPTTDLTQAPAQNDDETDDGLRTGSSAKIDQLIHLLRLTPSTDKSLVFSQFTGFLDNVWNAATLSQVLMDSPCSQIGDALDAEGIEYCRFDGKMSAKRRAETITKFSVPVKDTPAVDEEPVGMSSRFRQTTQSQPLPTEIDEGDNASDFVPDDHSDYIDTESDSDERPQGKRMTGKSKGKAKGRAPAKSKILEALEESERESNPRVMLISLKGKPFTSSNLFVLKAVS